MRAAYNYGGREIVRLITPAGTNHEARDGLNATASRILLRDGNRLKQKLAARRPRRRQEEAAGVRNEKIETVPAGHSR
jgi:hypothetical protein